MITSTLSPTTTRRVQRAILALAITIPALHLALVGFARRDGHPSDFGQIWAAARFLWAGINPYEVIGPHGLWQFEWPLLYPLPVVVAMMPLAWLSARWADALFLATGTIALVWALTQHRLKNPQLCMFASAAFLTVLGNVQWSPLMTAAALIPGLGFLLACKPTLGLAMLAAYPSKRAIIGVSVFGLLTVILFPWWVPAWLALVRAQSHIIAPVTLLQVGGPLVLLALLKWRRPEARLLAALACVPHNLGGLNEVLPLFLVVRTWTEGVILSALTFLVCYLHSQSGGATYTAWTIAHGEWSMLLIYLPCLVMVLRRPNVWPGASLVTPPRAPRRPVTAPIPVPC